MTSASYKILFTAAVISTFLLPCISKAQGGPPDRITEAQIDSLGRSYLHMAQFAMKAFKGVSSAQERILLDKIKILVGRNEQNIFAVYATRNGNTPIISISIDFIIVSYSVDAAFVYEYDHQARTGQPANLDRIQAYLDYLADIYRSGAGWFRSYLDWIGLTDDEVIAAREQMNKNEFGNAGFSFVSLAFVLGHEIGHHVLGHIGQKIGEREEAAADEFSMNLIIKAGYDLSMASGPFLLFDAINPHGTIPRVARTHPEALCRWQKLLFVTWGHLKKDPDFLAKMKAEGREKEIEKASELMGVIKADPNNDCNK